VCAWASRTVCNAFPREKVLPKTMVPKLTVIKPLHPPNPNFQKMLGKMPQRSLVVRTWDLLSVLLIEHFSQTFAHIKPRVLIQLYLVPEMLILEVRHFSGPRPAVFAGKPGPGGGRGVLSPPPRSSSWGLLLRAGGCVKVPTVTLARTRNPQTVRHS